MAFKPTLLAPKLNLRRAITSLNMSALATFLRSVAWVYKPDFYTFSFSFVSNKGLELSKAPSMQPAALSFFHHRSTMKIHVMAEEWGCN
jgi:hypothetical protein